ncbi:MAG: hypothetical protein U1A72_13345 [Sulfuritalea sp.]|nr:hypothetical protein [Sulfuritalea sp.]
MADKVSQSGRLIVVEATPLLDNIALVTTGDNVGGKLTFTSPKLSGRAGEGWILRAVTVTDKAKQSANLDLILFDSDPSGSTFTDNTAQTIVDADLVKIAGFVQITSYAAFADNSVGRGEVTREQPVILAADQKFYGCLVARAGPTYVALGDLLVRLTLEAV